MMKLKLYQLLKNVKNLVFKIGENIADAEERFHFGKVISKDESNKK